MLTNHEIMMQMLIKNTQTLAMKMREKQTTTVNKVNL
jgi:hypothetical protein